MNKVILIGNCGGDPAKSDKADVVNFSLATTERWKDSKGERQTHTEWFRIGVWGGLQKVCDFIKKGDSVYVEGTLRSRSWADKDGKPHTGLEVRAMNIQLLSNKRAQQEESGAKDDGPPAEYNDEDIPF